MQNVRGLVASLSRCENEPVLNVHTNGKKTHTHKKKKHIVRTQIMKLLNLVLRFKFTFLTAIMLVKT